ncbi:MAG: sulfotransferase [Pseudomonadota bacterium]
MSSDKEKRGSLEIAIERTAQLLDIDPAMAEQQAEEILKAVPNHPPGRFYLAMARRYQGKYQQALEVLEPLLDAQHEWAAAWFEYGVSLGHVGRGDEAIEALLKAVNFQPEHPQAWRYLGDHLTATGDAEKADAAYARHVQCAGHDPALQEAAAAMVKKDVATAERLLKARLKTSPTDVAAIRMLAEVAVRCDRNDEAENLLLRCLELSPGFTAARYNYAVILHRQNNSPGALTQIEQCLREVPESPAYRNLAAVILSRVGEYDRSIELYSQLLSEYPKNAKVWLSYGHVLKTAGKIDDCISAYKTSIDQNPAFGEAYWSLANLKTYAFGNDDLTDMAQQVDTGSGEDEDRWHLHFAMGKAAEDSGDYAVSFENYEKGNALYRSNYGYDPDLNSERCQRLIDDFTADVFAERSGLGSDADAPIFIVGMPRAGSTLLEQILSCHSQIEGTTELPDILMIAQALRSEAHADNIAVYAKVLAGKSAAELKALGDDYIERTRIHRKTDKPLFIDKMPNNFLHVGLIHLILPNAKIIDARRHPMGCCFSNFKQYYARGQNFSYNLNDVGQYYADYVKLMAHFDSVLPGRIHRVFYEDTVADTERVVRGMLDYCGLEFEEECLRFFESSRPVRTASSEQVRQPIYQDGLALWQHYEPWLDPLKNALGPVLARYPDVPSF